MIYDTHTHLFPPGVDKIGTAEMLLAQMDESGVDKAVIFGIYPRVSNQFIAQQVAQHSDRFIAFASVSPNDGPAALDLFDQCVTDFNPRGLKIHPTMQSFRADDVELLTPLMHRVARLNIPVLLHSWGWFGQDSEASPLRVVSLARAFPEVTFIMAHCGGMRFMDLLSLSRLRRPGRLDNLYVDLSVILFDLKDSPMWPFLVWTLRTVGLDRVLVGSDFPDYSLVDTFRLARSLGLSESEMDLILTQNSERLFGTALT